MGLATLLPSEGVRKKEGNEVRAKNAFVVLGVGMCIREKELVGLQYTAGCTDGHAIKEFLFDIINYIEKVANIEVDWLGFDIGPANQSFLNAVGISLTRGNKEYFIQHPVRLNDRLYCKPDEVHNIKNVMTGLRNNDYRFSKSQVEQLNLNTNLISFKEVKKIFNSQEKTDLKPARNLKQENIIPSNFEKMREKIAYEVFSPDVFTAIDFNDKNATENGKKNATSAFLQIMSYFHGIVLNNTGWTHENKDKFDEDIEYLSWIAEEFFPNIQCKTSLRCIPAISMSIRCLIDLSKIYFQKNYPKVVPAWFLSNAIENIFSMVTSIFKKPTAVTMSQALRVISVNQFEFDATSANYSWDDTEIPSIDFIELLQKFTEIENQRHSLQIDEETTIMPKIIINDVVDVEEIFANELDMNVFHCEVAKILSKSISSIKCVECLSSMIDSENIETTRSRLFDLKQNANREKTMAVKPSKSLWDYFLKLEFIFKRLCEITAASDASFSTSFNESASEVLVPYEHCYSTTSKILSLFLSERLKLNLHCYLPHKSVKHSSRSLAV